MTGTVLFIDLDSRVVVGVMALDDTEAVTVSGVVPEDALAYRIRPGSRDELTSADGEEWLYEVSQRWGGDPVGVYVPPEDGKGWVPEARHYPGGHDHDQSTHGHKGETIGPPAWWNEPSDNAFAKGMTKGEVSLDWLDRHEVQRDGDRYIFYRGEPKVHRDGTPRTLPTTLKPGTLLATDPEEARAFAGRYEEDVPPSLVAVLVVRVLPWEVDAGGVWASVRTEVSVGEEAAPGPVKRHYPGGHDHDQTKHGHKLLEPLRAEAAKYPTFDAFSTAYQVEIKHGLYWHVTTTEDFAIDPEKGPRDMSSIGDGSWSPGQLMVTSHLSYWLAEYPNRPYVARIDLSAVAPEDYRQVNRGFGNEFFVFDPSKAKVVGTYSRSRASAIDREYQAAQPQNEEELRAIWEAVHGTPSREVARWKNPDDAAKHPKWPGGALGGKGGQWAPKGAAAIIPNADEVLDRLMYGLISFVRGPLDDRIMGINEKHIREATIRDESGTAMERAFVKAADVEEEMAAHRVNEMMGGLLLMLPTAVRQISEDDADVRMAGRVATVQPWMDPEEYPAFDDYVQDDLEMQREAAIGDPSNPDITPITFSEQESYDLALFDTLTGNPDRHGRNAIVVDGHIVPVDRGRSFWGSPWTGNHLQFAHSAAYGHTAMTAWPQGGTNQITGDNCVTCARPLNHTLTKRQMTALRRLKKKFASGGRAYLEKASSRTLVDGFVKRLNYLLDKGVIPWDSDMRYPSQAYPVDL